MAAGLFEGGAHLLRVVQREGHGFLDVDVLAGVERGDEMFGVEMLRGGDEDGIHRGIFEEAAIVDMLAGSGRDGAGFFEAAGVDVSHAGAFGVGAGEGVAQEFGATGAGADNAEAYAIVGPEDVGRGEGAGESGGHIADEVTARLHDTPCCPVGMARNDYRMASKGSQGN